MSGDQFGAALVSETNARYYNLVVAGLVFGATWSAAALAAATASTVGSFGLVNPVGSGKNLVIIDWIFGITTFTAVASGTSAALASIAGSQTVTAQTPGNTPLCTLIGSTNKAVGAPITAGTIVGTPSPFRFGVNELQSATSSTYFNANGVYKDQIDGEVVLVPGSFINVIGVGGTPADLTVEMSMTWAEIPQ